MPTTDSALLTHMRTPPHSGGVSLGSVGVFAGALWPALRWFWTGGKPSSHKIVDRRCQDAASAAVRIRLKFTSFQQLVNASLAKSQHLTGDFHRDGNRRQSFNGDGLPPRLR